MGCGGAGDVARWHVHATSTSTIALQVRTFSRLLGLPEPPAAAGAAEDPLTRAPLPPAAAEFYLTLVNRCARHHCTGTGRGRRSRLGPAPPGAAWASVPITLSG